MRQVAILISFLMLGSCSSFKAERTDAKTSDEKMMKISDNWVAEDTRQAVVEVLKQIYAHKGYSRYMKAYKGEPKVFIAEVQNNTAEAYFPIADMNDELLNEISQKGDFVLVDAVARDKILDEITYQNDGMVDPATSKQIGKQIGADLMIFGSVNMKPEKRDGKTVKQYSVNIRMTDIQKGVEVLRTRHQIYKYSDKSAFGW